MHRSRVVFFFIMLGIVLGIWRCNSTTTTQTTAVKPAASVPPPTHSSVIVPPPNASPVVTPTTSPVLAQAATPAGPDLKKTAERVIPAGGELSVFDSAGRLLRNGTGFFISDDGRLVTSRSIVHGGAHAISPANDGKIYNVTGILEEAEPSDSAILKVQVKEKVPFCTPNKTAPFE